MAARQFNKRRSVKVYGDNIEDASECLRHFITSNNYVNVMDVVEIMNGLQTASLPAIQGAIYRAENSLTVMNTLLNVLKNVKKLKESQLKVITFFTYKACNKMFKLTFFFSDSYLIMWSSD